MNNNKNLSNIASTSTKRKRLVIPSDSDTDSDCEEIVCPVRNRRRIIVSDSEEESDSVNREINFISDKWTWENKENECKIWQYSRVPGMNIEMGERFTALEMLNQFLSKDFWNIIVTESNRYASQTIGDVTRKLKQSEEYWRDTNIDEIQAYFALCTSKKAECPILLVKKKYYPDFHFPENNAIAEICATLPFFTLFK